MHFVTEEEIKEHVHFIDVLEAIEAAFGALDDGRSEVFDIVRGCGADSSHFFGVKSAREGARRLIGVKAGSYNPINLTRGLQAHTSTTLLIDDDTAEPIAVVEANHLNGMRTAAANAAAVKRLARPNSKTLAVVGAGDQAFFEVAALKEVHSFDKVTISARRSQAAIDLSERIQKSLNLPCVAAPVQESISDADIIATVTSSTEPLFKAEWVRPGTHISAMGADNVGKQELPIELFGASSVFVDLPSQAILIGETQHAFEAGLVCLNDLEGCTLGALINGRHPGRRHDEEITIFDSSGIAIQDIAAAAAALDIVKARLKRRKGKRTEL